MTASRRSGSDGPLTARSLGRRLVLATLAFGLLFTLTTVALRTWSAWQVNLDSMTAELTLIDQVFQRALSKAIWEMDRNDLQTHVTSVAQVGAVGRIELRIPQAGRPPEILERRKEGAPDSRLAPSVHRVLSYEPYPGNRETVGELTIEGDERVLWSRLRSELAGIVVTQLTQSVLLAGLIMWLFNRSVTVHVRAIARHLGGLTPANLDRPLQLDRPASHSDELSLLESGVNQLQGSLSRYLERQRRDEHDLAAHRDRLAELVNEQTAELRAANARLEELSRIDPLTGLANRRHFDEAKEVEFRRARRLGLQLSVLLCDVDHFKRYNDTYGHAMGDECLKAVAGVIRQTFARAGELPARVGGEEFAVLLPAADAAQAREAAERLRVALAERGIPHLGSTTAPHVTLSIGLAQLTPDGMDTFDALLHHADLALYRAKSLGRDQVAIA
jgi:diguanylate cyclase (GGDEF)-like protein